MDPQATLWEILDDLHRGDRATACEHLHALAGWLESGGFLPEVQRPAMNDPARFSVVRQLSGGRS